ncbi:hypothetical protein LINPERHAP1_LOCUS21612, partial [Linum perenne]
TFSLHLPLKKLSKARALLLIHNSHSLSHHKNATNFHQTRFPSSIYSYPQVFPSFSSISHLEEEEKVKPHLTTNLLLLFKDGAKEKNLSCSGIQRSLSLPIMPRLWMNRGRRPSCPFC